MNNWKKGVIVVLTGSMIATTVTPVFAEDQTSVGKEEVIYINLQNDGNLKDVYAVNIFGKGNVTDYGDYSSVKILNTEDKLTQKDDKVTFHASKDRTYYEGKMKDTTIPWNIEVTYTLDGKQYTAEELAGKSGNLQIHFKITKNEACEGDYFDHYALQAAFTLDTDKCSNIVAEDATIANVGSDKQLSYTMLPGEGIDTTITADVKDFAMDAVSINGLPLSLDVDVDDEELMNQVNELIDAIDKLDDGAGELKDGTGELQDAAQGNLQGGVKDLLSGAGQLQNGAGELQDGGTQLQDGTDQLKSGADELYKGITSLNNGIISVQRGLNALNQNSEFLASSSSDVNTALQATQTQLNNISVSTDELTMLVTGSTGIKNGLGDLSSGLTALQSSVSYNAYKKAMSDKGVNIDNLQTNNQNTIDALNAQIAVQKEAGEDTSQLESIVQLLKGNQATISGTGTYLVEVNKNIGTSASGAEELNKKYASVDEGIQQIAETVSGMSDQLNTLKAGIDELTEKYGELDGGIQAYTSGVSELASGYSQIVTGSGSVLAGSKSLKEGTSELYGKTGQLLSGIASFYQATGSLKDGTGKLDDGVADLLVGIENLYDGAGELKGGAGELRDETDGMDTEISDKIDDMLDSITGGDAETVSFVSDKNTDVDSVQFVIQTEAVKVKEKETTTKTTEKEKTVWEKFLHLFKLD